MHELNMQVFIIHTPVMARFIVSERIRYFVNMRCLYAATLNHKRLILKVSRRKIRGNSASDVIDYFFKSIK